MIKFLKLLQVFNIEKYYITILYFIIFTNILNYVESFYDLYLFIS